jgi:hypothetical protein
MGAEFAVGLAARGATTVISYAGDEDVAAKTLARLEERGVSAEAVRTERPTLRRPRRSSAVWSSATAGSTSSCTCPAWC